MSLIYKNLIKKRKIAFRPCFKAEKAKTWKGDFC